MLTNRRIKKIFLNVAGFFIFIVAVILRVPQLYLMAAILLLIPFVSYCTGRLLMLGLTCARRLPTSCAEGEHVPVTLRVTNTGPLPKFTLRVRDRLPQWLEGVGPDAPPILQLWPGEMEESVIFLEPKKRGVYRLSAVQVVSTDPFGFYAFSQDVPAVSELLVYPTVLPLSRAAVGGGGYGRREREGRLLRGGMDFDGVREWRPGDELRRVHWRTTARTGELAVVEYAQGMASDVTLALDLNRAAYADTGAGPDGALEVAIRIAASLAACFLREGWVVRFVSSDADGPLLLSEPAHLPRLLETLARAEAHSDAPLGGALDAARAAGAGGALVYVTPDAQSPALLLALAGWGGRAQGWALDRASFLSVLKRGKAGTDGVSAFDAAPFTDGGDVKTVRRGDDLQAVLEGGTYAQRN